MTDGIRSAQRILITAVGLLATFKTLDECIQYFKARLKKMREEEDKDKNRPKIIVVDRS